MLVIVGYVIIILSVFGGFALADGHLFALLQPTAVLIIGGTAIGALLVGNTGKAVMATLKALPSVLKGARYTKDSYMELMALLYELLGKMRKEGLMSIEGDVENPQESAIFAKYPSVLTDYHVVEFAADYLRIMVSGNFNAEELENLMDVEIATRQHEAMVPSRVIARMGDGLPPLGIVAAGVGVIHTLASNGVQPEKLTDITVAVLVSITFGILLAYGFVGPLATLLAQKAEESSKMFQAVKVTLMANLNGYAPAMAVEFGRKSMYSTERPGFLELEQYVKQKR